MVTFSAAQVQALISMPRLVESLRDAFRTECIAPPRQVVQLPASAADRLFLSMPAFDHEGGVVKLVTVFPGNPARGLPTIQAAIVVFSANGVPIAMLDGGTVTKLRTGAASALASSYLSREDSEHLVIIGTGALSPYMALAHCSVRPIKRISIFGRRLERAEETAAAVRNLTGADRKVSIGRSLEEALATADIVSCSTSSTTPVLAGKWLRAGTFVDLVGSFSPTKREADDDVVVRSRIFVDTFEGAWSEAGDILEPLSRGVIQRAAVLGELADVVNGRVAGRSRADEITLFKSVGTAIEDLAAARLVLQASADAHASALE